MHDDIIDGTLLKLVFCLQLVSERNIAKPSIQKHSENFVLKFNILRLAIP